MLAAFDLGWAIHAYTKCGRRLVSADYDLRLVRGGMVMGRIYTAVMVVPLAAAFVSPTMSFVLYGMIVVAFIAFTLLGRWEVVMVWPSERGDEQGDRRVGVVHRS